jgi:hypothetical protein
MPTKLTPAQLDRVRRLTRQWQGTPAPCGISYADPYNPCLPEEDGQRLLCLTCWEPRRLATKPP